ncbi:hypothetical protein QBC47DRAFT_47378 [Echria macrotheca]|uniref:DUF7371 domain-containing protein n=1 Tax=Echria macrotheca TaxID=438768 RepID=A0AAJ0BBK1_9PEZI|nr:hypothetical protein QBC47DRAFT_47378 [Echria macrotheca]
MRRHASLRVLAGIAWLTSAAALPRFADVDTSTTCTTTGTGLLTAPGPISTILPAAFTVLTVTLGSGDPGSPSGSFGSASGSSSSSCTSTGTSSPVLGQSSSGTDTPVTVTITQLPTPLKSTVTVPVLTVTLPQPSGNVPGAALTASGGNGNSAASFMTVTIPESPGIPGSGATVTIPVVPAAPTSGVTVTVPASEGTSAGSVLTVTIPEGPSNTATLVLTVTVPATVSPGIWSTVITAPGGSGPSPGPVVTVSFFSSESSLPQTVTPSSGLAPGLPSTLFPLTVATITVPLSPPQSTGQNPIPSIGGPVTVTYTIPPEAGRSTPLVGTVTIAPPGQPSSLPNSWVTGPGTATVTAGVTPTVVSLSSVVPGGLSSSCTTTPSVQLITYTVPQQGTTPGYTGVFTWTSGGPPLWGGSSPTGTQPGALTITQPLATVSVFPVTITVPGGGQVVTSVTVTIPGATVSVSPSAGGGGGPPGTAGPLLPGTAQSVITVTVPQATGQPSVFTITLPSATAFVTPSSENGGSFPSTLGQSSVVTITQSLGHETASPTDSNATNQPTVLTITLPASGTAGVPVTGTSAQGYGMPIPGSSSPSATVSGSLVIVTYTAFPTVAGGTPSPYTVTYTVHPTTPASATSPGSGSPGANGPGPSFTSSAGPTPVIVTIGPGNGSGSPVVFTFTPNATPSSQQAQTFGTATVTAQPVSGLGSILTVTVEESNSPTPAGSGYGAGGLTSPHVATFTPNGGTPVTVTLPWSTSFLTPGGQPSTATGLGPSPTVVTITPVSGSPVVVTLPGTASGSPSMTGQPAVVTITEGPSASLGTPGSQVPGVFTITPASGSPITVTVPATTATVYVVTVTPLSGSPLTVTLPGSTVTASPTVEVITVFPSSGSPITITLPAATETVSAVQNSVITITPVSGAPLTVTLPATTTTLSGTFPDVFTTITVTPVSGSPVTITVPVGSQTVSAGQHSSVLTALTGSSTGGVASTVITVTPSSGSPFVVTVPLPFPTAPAASTAPSIPTRVTITVSPATQTFTTSVMKTILVSDVTLTETLPIGSGRFTVVEFTTEVTITPTVTASSSGLVTLTPTTITTTISDAYGQGPVVLTYTTVAPIITGSAQDVWTTVTLTPLVSASGSGSGQTGSGSEQTGTDAGLASGSTAQVVTIWPTDGYGSITGSPIIATINPGDLASPTVSVLTIWPSLSTVVVSATDTAGSGGAIPSEITLWPPASSDTTCTTFSTKFRGSSGLTESEPGNVVPFTVITITPTVTALGGDPSTSCTKSTQLLGVTNSALPASTASSATAPAGEPGISSSGSSPESEIPPPQTEFREVGRRQLMGRQTSGIVVVTISIAPATSLGGYEFTSAQGYGDPVPEYGTVVSVITSLPGSTSALLSPLSHMSSAQPVSTSSALPFQGTSAASASSTTAAAPLASSPIPTPLSSSLPPPLDSTSPALTSGTALPTPETTTGASNATSTVPTSALPSSTCGSAGDRGEVVFQFDDIPTITGGNGSSPPQPVPFPYHRFFFSSGFTVVPPPSTRYQPSSGIQMTQYNTSVSPTAQIGLAQLQDNSCFRFNFLGISLGCDSTDQSCVFDITGLQWNGDDNVVQSNRTLEIAACPDGSNCTLSHQILDSAAAMTFSNLTAINITLTVGGQPRNWWGDDLQIAWSDNSCAAATCRSRVPNTIMIPRKSAPVDARAKRLLGWAARRQSHVHK